MSQRPSTKLTASDIRSLSLPARLGVHWRRAHGDPTSQLEAEELRSLRGPTPLARFVQRVVVIAALATVAGSLYVWLDATHRLESERAAAARIVASLFAKR